MAALAGPSEDRRTEIVRWGAAFAAMLSLYVGLGALLLTREPTVARDALPPAVMVDFAPVSAASPAESAAAPEQAEPAAPAAPAEPVAPAQPQASAEPEEEVTAAPPRAAAASAPLPSPAVVPRNAAAAPPAPKPLPKAAPPKPKPVVKREPEPDTKLRPNPQKPEREKPRPVPKREAARPAPVRPAEKAAAVAAPALRGTGMGASTRTASIAGQAAAQPSPSLPGWHALVRARLQALQRYPAEAQATGEGGTTTVAFVMDRGGRVLSARVAASSGSALLDQVSVATVRSASLPPPPADVPGATFPFSIPLRYRPR